MSKLLDLLFVALTVTLTSCFSNTTQTEPLADRTEAAEEAIKNGADNKAELLRVLLETDMERGRRAYQRTLIGVIVK